VAAVGQPLVHRAARCPRRTDLGWLRRDGGTLATGLAAAGLARAGRLIIGAPGRSAQPLLLLFNAEPADTPFVLPAGRWAGWQPLLDTADDTAGSACAPCTGHTLLAARSVQLLVALPAAPSPSTRTGA
jgi:pullulanase/glycogen debranching enzyme